jgi:hypothetical protein
MLRTNKANAVETASKLHLEEDRVCLRKELVSLEEGRLPQSKDHTVAIPLGDKLVFEKRFKGSGQQKVHVNP